MGSLQTFEINLKPKKKVEFDGSKKDDEEQVKNHVAFNIVSENRDSIIDVARVLQHRLL